VQFKVALDPIFKHLRPSVDSDIECVIGTSENLPFRDETFDFVFNINSLDHSDNPKSVMKEIYRSLKEHADFVLMVHVVSLKEKVVHYAFHKAPSHYFLFRRPILRVFNPIIKRISAYNIVNDGVYHPFFVRKRDVDSLINGNQMEVVKELLLPSPFNYKKELFLIARKSYTAP